MFLGVILSMSFTLFNYLGLLALASLDLPNGALFLA
jgi:hypothetical protein